MNKNFIINTLNECKNWKEETIKSFRTDKWELNLRKEESIYSPFTFSLYGKKIGTTETWSRRYVSAEEAFLHILNEFNENAAIKNKYKTLKDALSSIK